MILRIQRRVVRTEDGATLIIAMMVMLILATLSLAVLSRTLSSMAFIRNGQDYDAALAAADAGLSDALYKIDQNAPATWTSPVTTAGSGTYQYKAIKKSDTEYEVRSIGEVGGSKHGVRAKVTRTAKYPYVLFSKQDLTFNGNSTLNLYSFLVLGGPTTGQAHVGSNGKIIVNSGKGAGDSQHFYAPNGGCIGCPNPVEHKEGPYAVEPVKAPASHSGCPAVNVSGTWTIAGVVNPGTYVCTVDVTFTGTVSVSGNSPFILYLVRANASSAYPRLDIGNAIINPLGTSRNFQILKEGDGVLDVGVGNTSATLSYNGIMYAPESTVVINGGKYWVGSWTVNKVTINGGPNINIGYDLDLETYLGIDWKVSRYAEVSSASIPLT
jgi:hypothetical protein